MTPILCNYFNLFNTWIAQWEMQSSRDLCSQPLWVISRIFQDCSSSMCVFRAWSTLQTSGNQFVFPQPGSHLRATSLHHMKCFFLFYSANIWLGSLSNFFRGPQCRVAIFVPDDSVCFPANLRLDVTSVVFKCCCKQQL